MDFSQVFDVFVRSATSHHPDSTSSGSGDLSDGVHDDHFAHAHPGTVLFLFVAIAVGGKRLYIH